MKCVNIDWLEVYCLEDDIGYPHDADYFRRSGWQVEEREYGTPVYKEMFKLVGYDGESWFEVRRAPKSDTRQLNGLFDYRACHVRLANRTCYFTEAAKLLADFLEQNGLHFQRIARLDLALDFVRFDFGDYPEKFLQRYMNGTYSKINQANINGHGTDRWDGRCWNSVSWGAQSSMIVTRFYNKKLELKTVKDKPYIRQAWRACGLVDDEQTLEKHKSDGTVYYPDIWRVEFQIKSGTKKWFVVEDYNGQRKQIRSIHHTLQDYYTRAQLLDRFYSLAHHYFHFKHYDKKQRKDRCPDKKLFDIGQVNNFYSIDNVATAKPKKVALDTLLSRLIEYRDTHPNPATYKACNVLIEQLENERRRNNLTIPWNMDEVEALRILVAKRLRDQSRPLADDIRQAKEFVEIQKTLWNETTDN